MKHLSLILGVLAVGCVVCHVEPEPEVLEFEGAVEIHIEGEMNNEPNAPTGYLMDGLADGLIDGDCWGGNSEGYIIGLWYSQALPLTKTTVAWLESSGEISYIGGTGACDSVIYVSTTKAWPGIRTSYLWEADLSRYISNGVATIIPIAEQNPQGSLLDTVNAGDNVQISWEVTANDISSATSNYPTDTLLFDLIEGVKADNMPYCLYIDFVYANADTSRRTVSGEKWLKSDTSETRAIFTAQDTTRDLANDTLYGMNLINSHGEIVAVDTTDRYMQTNKAAKMVWTIYLFSWPQ